MVQWFCLVSPTWSILRIFVQSDTVNDLILFVGHLTYISWSIDFALYLWLYVIDKHQTLGICSIWHWVWPHISCRSLWPIFHGPVILPCISIMLWILVQFHTASDLLCFVGHCNLYLSSDFALYLPPYQYFGYLFSLTLSMTSYYL